MTPSKEEIKAEAERRFPTPYESGFIHQDIREKQRIFIESCQWMQQQAEQGWISVEERLPEHHQRIIACTDKGDVGWGWYSNYLDGYTFLLSSIPEYKEVTHWQPLPEKPTKK